MTYQPGIPTGSVPLNQDYLNLQGNFTVLNNVFSEDHSPLTGILPPVGTAGYHTVVHLVDNVSRPVKVVDTGEIFSIKVNDGLSTDEQLFYQSGENGFFTNLTRNFQPTPVANGATFLPGGLILNWGSQPIAANNTLTTVNFAQPYTSPTNVFSITVNRITSDNSSTGQEIRIVSGSVTASSFKISSSSSSAANSIYWMALGI